MHCTHKATGLTMWGNEPQKCGATPQFYEITLPRRRKQNQHSVLLTTPCAATQKGDKCTICSKILLVYDANLELQVYLATADIADPTSDLINAMSAIELLGSWFGISTMLNKTAHESRMSLNMPQSVTTLNDGWQVRISGALKLLVDVNVYNTPTKLHTEVKLLSCLSISHE